MHAADRGTALVYGGLRDGRKHADGDLHANI
jgi:hypothetical protein